jgi:hypothetical protein
LILPFLSLVLIGCGIVLTLVARGYKMSQVAPVGSTNPRHWIPIWRTEAHFRPPGYSLNLVGFCSISAGGLLLLVKYLVLR